MRRRTIKYITCIRCKKLYPNRADQPLDKFSIKQICPQCREEEENQVAEVQRILMGLDSITVAELSQRTGIEEETVRRLVDDHQINLGASKVRYPCSICGAEVTDNLKYCVRCMQNLSATLAEEASILNKKMASSDRIYRPSDKSRSHTASSGARQAFEDKKKVIAPPDPGTKIK